MGRLDSIYARLPVPAQHGAVTAYGLYWSWLRFGPGYHRLVKEYQAREQYNLQAWQTWQQARVIELLTLAATHVPYYQRTWSAAKKQAACAGRLVDLPFLEKDVVRSDSGSFVRQDGRLARQLVFHTSGSTGTPVATLWSVVDLRRSMALREVRSANWAGVSFSLPRATFSGRLVEPNPASRGPFYRFNAVERQVYLSAFHIRPDTAAAYVEALRRHHVQWLTGYAVSYYLLATLILEQKLPVPPLKAIITTSEKVTDDMRAVMETAYGCQVFEEYSTVENALFASECAYGRLHLSPDAGVVEILRADGTPCEPGEVGEVVATSLVRSYQPFIRYRLGDLAAWDTDPCPCGRAMPILKEVVGRVEDVVVGPDGRRLVRFHGIFTNQPHVREGQIIQETRTKIRARVVPVGNYSEMDTLDIIHRIQQRLGTEVEVVVEPVDSIPRTKAGKFQAVVSLLRGPDASTEGNRV